VTGLRRRQFVRGAGLVSLGLLAGCGRTTGQATPASKVWRLGWLNPGSAPWPFMEDLLGGLQEWGYFEGQNFTLEPRYAGTERDRLRPLAAELVRLPVDVIITHGTASTQAVHQETTMLPIVFMAVSDPIEQGFVASLARPGGNLTGTSDFGVALSGKRLELLRDSVPGTTRVAVLRDLGNPASDLEWRATEDAARTLAIPLLVLEVRGAEDLPSAFEAARAAQCQSLLLLTTGLTSTHLPQLVSLAVSNGLPVMYFQRAQPAAGGLMAYGPRYTDVYRRTGYYVDRILKGTKPADLPVEQPTTFDFVINLKTARALGLAIPQHVLLQATEVLQ
jgi:putative tryptophan/tyrosine transport system substrate-binding protein